MERGDVVFANLRGRTAYPQAVQAAEGFIAQQNLRLLHVESEDEATEQLAVTFADAARRHQIQVARQRQPIDVLAGCDKTETKAYYPFVAL